jgi:aspartate/methionine/tyrosine aminotransferase
MASLTGEGAGVFSMQLAALGARLVVVRFADVQEYAQHCGSLLAGGADDDAFTSVTVTREEVSVVLEQARFDASTVPTTMEHGSTIKVEEGWRIIKVEGPLDFSLLGILSRLATTLCEAGVSIFVISTYDTDYLMVKEKDLEAAVGALKSAGHTFNEDAAPPAAAAAAAETSDETSEDVDEGNVAGFEPFQLERYFARHEFSAPHLLCCSDIQPWSQTELLSMADDECQQLWNNLSLGYTESQGLPVLRDEIASMYDGCATSDVLLTIPEEGIYIACRALLKPGDKVVVPWPCYQSLSEVASAIGCEVVRWEPDPDTGRFSVDALDVLVDDTTRLVVVNFPHNPTGATIAQDELDSIVEICAWKEDCWLLSDEMYRGLEYDPATRLRSVATMRGAGGQYDKCVSLAGMSKVYGLPGLRVGWLVTRHKGLYGRLCQLKDYTTICASAPSEILALIGLRNHAAIVEHSMGVIKAGLAVVSEFMAEFDDIFEWEPPTAGSIAFPALKSIEKFTATQFCDAVVEQCGVMLLPSSVYGLPTEKDARFRLGFGRTGVSEAVAVLREHLRGIIVGLSEKF